MRCTLSSVGVPLGTVVLTAGERTIAPLDVAPAYALSEVRQVARAIGIAFHAIDWARLAPRVRARALAAAVVRVHELQCMLSLTDAHGSDVPAASVLVIEFTRDPVPLVVVNLRDLPSNRDALVAPRVRRDVESARPATAGTDANQPELDE